MPTVCSLDVFWKKQDERFFRDHPGRQLHIRKAWDGECAGEFWSLGAHSKDRRRVLLIRVDAEGRPLPDGQIMKIPLIAWDNEEFADTDERLLPLLNEIMGNAAQKNQQA